MAVPTSRSRIPRGRRTGGSIAFAQTDTNLQGADPNISILPAGGGEPRLITGFGSQVHPDWSPDARLIAYTRGYELGPDDIRVVRPDGTGDGPVTDDISVPDGWPAWAPSGRRLAIGRLGRIWTHAPDGSELRQLTHGPDAASDWDANWQPRPKRRGRAGNRPRRLGTPAAETRTAARCARSRRDTRAVELWRLARGGQAIDRRGDLRFCRNAAVWM